MNDVPDSELSARISRVAESLDSAADRYQREVVGRRRGGTASHQGARVRFLGGIAAASALAVVATISLTNRDVRTTDLAVDAAAASSSPGSGASAEQASVPPVAVTTAVPTFDPAAVYPSTTTFEPLQVVDLGWQSSPTEIVFPAGAAAVELRAWFGDVAAGSVGGSVTTLDVGPEHGSGTFRAKANQKISVSAQFAATVTVSLLDTTTTDPVVAVFTLPGLGSARLPATGRYSIQVDTQVIEPSKIMLWIR